MVSRFYKVMHGKITALVEAKSCKGAVVRYIEHISDDITADEMTPRDAIELAITGTVDILYLYSDDKPASVPAAAGAPVASGAGGDGLTLPAFLDKGKA